MASNRMIFARTLHAFNGLITDAKFEKPFYIVVYHNIVSNIKEPFEFDFENVSCDIHEFERQIVFLKKYFTVITYSELNKSLFNYSYSKPPLIITFDDGYVTFYDLAAPILRKYGCQATVFISTDYIGSNKIYWWDEISYYCKKLTLKKFFKHIFSKYFIAETNLQYYLNEDNEDGFIKYLLSYLKVQEDSTIESFLRFIKEKTKDKIDISAVDKTAASILNWDQVKELAGQGIEFGSHTSSHCRLNFADSSKIKHEIASSIKRINNEIGSSVESFCFPGGEIGPYSDFINCNLKDHGIKYACTMKFGINTIRNGKYAHKRISIDKNTTVSDLKKYLFTPWMIATKNTVKSALLHMRTVTSKLEMAYKILKNKPKAALLNSSVPIHIFFCICDHYEPYWHRASHKKALLRVECWKKNLPKIFNKHSDSDFRCPKYNFFYPQEEYNKKILDIISELCKEGYGEVNVHLHHDNDTSTNLTRTLMEYKNLLANEHKLLCFDKTNGEISYGFIHGNWALDNSSPDGRWCGVNNELEILRETGCFADFTLPSAPDASQTKKMNSIYYAIDEPTKAKSHDKGLDAETNIVDRDGLLLVQGVIGLRFRNGKLKIENSEISSSNPPDSDRIEYWVRNSLYVKGKKDWRFIKIHTHGTQRETMRMLFEDNYLDSMMTYLEDNYNDGKNYRLHYVSAREMVNIIHAIEMGEREWKPELLDFKYKLK